MRAQVNRRDILRFGAATAAAGSVPSLLTSTAQAARAERRLLFYTKSATFEHSVVRRGDKDLAHAERIVTELGQKNGFEVTATKDGRIFDEPLDKWHAIFFYTTGDLTKEGTDKQPPISPRGKQALLEAVHGGKGFIGSHCASDTFHSVGKAFENQKELDPYIAMLGGEFIRHGRQQTAHMTVVDPHFPGIAPAGRGFDMHEEWYSLKNFAPDIHVLLVNETEGMQDKDYERPPYPATWCRKHGAGRVFYTSMGHREDVWTNPVFQSLLVGGIQWAMGDAEADLTPNLREVTPHADQLPVL